MLSHDVHTELFLRVFGGKSDHPLYQTGREVVIAAAAVVVA